MNNKLQAAFLSVMTLCASALISAVPIDTEGLPENVVTYIQQRALCDQAREILINQLRSKQPVFTIARQNAQKYCLGSDATHQKLLNQYQNNSSVVEKINLATGMGYMVFLDAPIQFGQTIDALMPQDIVAVLPQISNCLHFAGEFSGNGSKEDKEVARRMDKLKCNQVKPALSRLQKNHQNNADALMFITVLQDLF